MKVCPVCGEAYDDAMAACPKDGAVLKAIRDPFIGKTVGGRYRLISRLGSGGMSSVYLARHLVIDRLVAVKTLRRDLAQDPVQRDRFIREARAVNRINHENIVEITDFGETEDGLVYLVMEYVPGEPLLRSLADGPFPAMRALDIAEQIAGALARAHQMGVVHRDLKPENVLLVPLKGGRDFVKILDFGIAKILDAPSLTGSQQIFGTPGYIAPEYIQSTAIDGRADLYSLGVILYELVTGALPFDYEYPGDLLVKHVTDPPVPPRERHGAVEEPMEQLIMRCLEKDPDQRFRDAFHFLEELRAVRERLGPDDSWGGLNEETQPPPEDPRGPTPVIDGPQQADLLKRTIIDEHPPEAVQQALRAAQNAPLGRASSDTTEESREEISARLRIPSAPAIPIPTTSQPPPPERTEERPTADTGVLGVKRWRARYDALIDATREWSLPDAVESALAFSSETLGNLEAGVSQVAADQVEIERLSEEARDFRATIGRAIDKLAEKLSGEKRKLEQSALRRNELRARHESLMMKVRQREGDEGPADAVLWELATIEQELGKQASLCDGIESQLGELRTQLDRKNQDIEDRLASLVTRAEAEVERLDALSQALRVPLERVETFVRGRWAEDDTGGSPTPSSAAG